MTSQANAAAADGGRPDIGSMLREAAAFLRALPRREPANIEGPPGDGHAVFLLPAVMRGDGQTAGMRRFLAAKGYTPYGWRLGVNIGPLPRLTSAAMDRLTAIAAKHGPASLIGYSMGGLFARWLALRRLDCVRQVITVCAPFNDPLHSTWFPLEFVTALWPSVDLRALAAEVGRPLPVPGTFIYCRTDGIVDWRCCIDESAPRDNIEVTGDHTTMAANAQVRRIILERLARSRT